MLKTFTSTIRRNTDGGRSVLFSAEVEIKADQTFKPGDNWEVLNELQRRVNGVTAPLVEDVPQYAKDDCKI